jgi:hypothetical protein
MFTFKHRRTHAAKGRACIHAPPKKKTSQQIADENVIMPFEADIVKMHVEGIHTNTWMPRLWYVNFIGQLGLPCHLPVLLAPTTQIPWQLCHMSRRMCYGKHQGAFQPLTVIT